MYTLRALIPTWRARTAHALAAVYGGQGGSSFRPAGFAAGVMVRLCGNVNAPEGSVEGDTREANVLMGTAGL